MQHRHAALIAVVLATLAAVGCQEAPFTQRQQFILIGQAINIGGRINPGVLLQRIAWKSVAMLLLLSVFKMIEELVVGMTHGHSATQVITEFMARGWMQNIAPGVVMLLVLIPLMAYEELDKALGKGSLKRMLLERRQES